MRCLNSLKSVEAGAENKSEVQQLTKRISSGNGNFKAKKIIPETIREARQSCFMQEMVVKYNGYLAHDFQINKEMAILFFIFVLFFFYYKTDNTYITYNTTSCNYLTLQTI